MKMFKKIIGTTLVASMLFIGTSTLTSCAKQGCTDSTANNYDADAKEDDGTCTYDRDAFIGTYSVSEICSGTPFSYNITISESSANTVTVTLGNFGDYSVTVNGTVSGTNLVIASQTVDVTGDAYTFAGTGSLNGNVLTINYTATYNTTTDVCVATCNKQ
jgi:hypothetical protein